MSVCTTHRCSIIKHNMKESKHNRGKFWEISKSILGKISSITDGGLFMMHARDRFHALQNLCVKHWPLTRLIIFKFTIPIPVDKRKTLHVAIDLNICMHILLQKYLDLLNLVCYNYNYDWAINHIGSAKIKNYFISAYINFLPKSN